MAKAKARSPRPCVYCGQPAKKVRRGEHIIPDAIHGDLTVNEVSDRDVCNPCNNGPLSVVDKELCNRSFLSVIASQEIDATIWQSWDIDHDSDNLLVESRPQWEQGELVGLFCWPQMTFEPDGPEIRGDFSEAKEFGQDEYGRVLTEAIRNAFKRYHAGDQGAINLDRVRLDLGEHGYRFAPRLFTPRSIRQIAENIEDQSFVLRYTEPEDRLRVMQSLGQETATKVYGRWTGKANSRRPPIGVYFTANLVVRALIKIGVNLLAAYAAKTPVSPDSFPMATGLVKGDRHPSAQLVESSGFANEGAFRPIAESGCHSFRLVHKQGVWGLYSCFFGGRIGAYVLFPGPNDEAWNTLDVVAPLKSKEWRVTTSRDPMPLIGQLSWTDLSIIAPSLKMDRVTAQMVAEPVPVHERRD